MINGNNAQRNSFLQTKTCLLTLRRQGPSCTTSNLYEVLNSHTTDVIYMGPKNEEPLTEVPNQMGFQHMAPESREQRASPLQFSLFLTSNSKHAVYFYRVGKVGEYTTVLQTANLCYIYRRGATSLS